MQTIITRCNWSFIWVVTHELLGYVTCVCSVANVPRIARKNLKCLCQRDVALS